MNAGLQNGDKNNFYLISANKTKEDVLLAAELNQLKEADPDHFHLFYLVDKMPAPSLPQDVGCGEGYITQEQV